MVDRRWKQSVYYPLSSILFSYPLLPTAFLAHGQGHDRFLHMQPIFSFIVDH